MNEVIPPVEVPLENLDPATLHALIESFVLREGTDYGSAEVSLSTKVAQVQRQVEKGDVKIVFDAATETVTLMTKKDFNNANFGTERATKGAIDEAADN